MRSNLREILSAPLLDAEGQPRISGQSWGYIFGALGAMLFSMKAVFVKMAYLPTAGLEENALDAITLLGLRFGFSVPVYIGILIWALRKNRRALTFSMVIKAASLGLLGYYICAFLDFQGLKYITAQLERLLLFTYPAMVVILGAIFFGGRITWRGLLAIVLAYGGVALIFLRGEIATGLNVPLGSALILLTAFLFALFQLFAKRVIDKVGSEVFTCGAMIMGASAALAHYLTVNLGAGTADQILNLPPRIYGIGILLALFSTILPSFLINIAIGRVGAQMVAVLGLVGPVATIVAAVFFLGEPFGPVDALGSLITFSGVSMFMWIDRRAARRKAALKSDPEETLPAIDTPRQ